MKTLPAPKTIKATMTVIVSRWFSTNPMNLTGFDGLMPEELAAWIGLDSELCHRAMAKMAKNGQAKFESNGSALMPRGWYRATTGDARRPVV